MTIEELQKKLKELQTAFLIPEASLPEFKSWGKRQRKMGFAHFSCCG
jgi:hypothetical protein